MRIENEVWGSNAVDVELPDQSIHTVVCKKLVNEAID